MDYAIRINQLTKMFGKFIAVNSITMDIKPGEVCGFLGPNGAGKSTVMRMLCGILEPTSGSAQVLGFNLLKDPEEIKRHIGYMSQKFSLYDDLTVIENLDFYAGLYAIPYKQRRTRIEDIINTANLNGKEGGLVATLSQGYKQRLALGCAILSHPAVIFLDEPTSGVSPTSRRDFFNIIQELANRGSTVIVTTHFMDEAERCDRIAFFNEGNLMALDSPDSLKHNKLDGALFELTLPDPLAKLPDIQALSFVKECNLHGLLLHILANRPADRIALQDFTGYDPIPIIPSLEDVFVALSRKKESGDHDHE